MLKKIILITVVGSLSAYLVFAIVRSGAEYNGENKCKSLQVEALGDEDSHYVGEKQVIAILQKAGIAPTGKAMSDVDAGKIESVLEANSLIKQAECYKTVDGVLKIKVEQRTPLLRVIANKGEYYVDTEGKKMPVPPNFSAYLPVATGYIENDFAQNELYHFALFLKKNKFWDSQIEQIYVAPNRDIELTPRVGNHQIVLGKIENYEENLNKLKLFYDKGLNKVGWNKYSKINLKYKNQIVCTRNF